LGQLVLGAQVVAVDETPCRRAASASDNPPSNTANTTRICSSTATCRDGFRDLLTQTPFVTGQLRPLPQSLTHLRPFDRVSVDAPCIEVNTTDGYDPGLDEIVAFLNA
jgi:hypothetical protein